MSPAREYVLGEALKDIWTQGAKAAEAEQREYTADEYYRQLDGLRYKEIVKLHGPDRRHSKISIPARRPEPVPKVRGGAD